MLEEFKQHVLRLEKPPPYEQHSILFESLTDDLCRHPQVLPHIISGLQTYFDRALGANLLYRFERPQYAGIRKKYITGPDVKVGDKLTNVCV
jgi:mortality factor 4-like protein 1